MTLYPDLKIPEDEMTADTGLLEGVVRDPYPSEYPAVQPDGRPISTANSPGGRVPAPAPGEEPMAPPPSTVAPSTPTWDPTQPPSLSNPPDPNVPPAGTPLEAWQQWVAIWRQNDLTLRGVGERPHLRAGGRAADGKAIWVIKGDRVTVDNLEFSGTRVPSHNGAGIRAEGAGLTIRNCRFHHNEMGYHLSDKPELTPDKVPTKLEPKTSITRRESLRKLPSQPCCTRDDSVANFSTCRGPIAAAQGQGH